MCDSLHLAHGTVVVDFSRPAWHKIVKIHVDRPCSKRWEGRAFTAKYVSVSDGSVTINGAKRKNIWGLLGIGAWDLYRDGVLVGELSRPSWRTVSLEVFGKTIPMRFDSDGRIMDFDGEFAALRRREGLGVYAATDEEVVVIGLAIALYEANSMDRN